MVRVIFAAAAEASRFEPLRAGGATGLPCPPHALAREEPARYGVLPKDSVCRDNPVLCCMLTSPGPEKIALRKTLPTEILGGIANVV